MAIDWCVERFHSSTRLRAGFTSRYGGVSSAPYDSLNPAFHVGDNPSVVQANRNLLDAELGTQSSWMNQVHSSHLALARPGAIFDNTDGLIIDLERIEEDKAAACVMVADCIPLVLISIDKPRAAVVHVGRAGFMLNIAGKAVAELDSELIAVLGPSICGSCYEVSEEMRDQAAAIVSEAASETSWGSPAIDIRAGLLRQLQDAGVKDIQRLDRCTYEDDNYFSYRRACHQGEGRTGRFIGVALVERV